MITQTKPTCQKRVHSDSKDFTGHLCTFTVVGQEEGANWCSRHLPSARKAKTVASHATWEAKWAAERAGIEAKQRQQAENARKLAAFDDLVDAAEAYALAVTMNCDQGQGKVVREFMALVDAIKEARSA